jgi:hypothetical protein
MAPAASAARASDENERRFVESEESAAVIDIEGNTFIVAPLRAFYLADVGNVRGEPATIERNHEKSHADAHIIPGGSDISMA